MITLLDPPCGAGGHDPCVRNQLFDLRARYLRVDHAGGRDEICPTVLYESVLQKERFDLEV